MIPPSWTGGELCIRLSLSLGHFLWQGTAIALLASLALACLRRASSRTRYGVSVVAMGLMALCLPLTFMLVEAPRVSSMAARDASRGAQLLTAGSETPELEAAMPADQLHSTAAVARTGPRPAPAKATHRAKRLGLHIFSQFHRWAGAVWPRLSVYAAMCYLLGVLAMLGRLALGLRGGSRLRQLSQPVHEPQLLEMLARQAKALRLSFTPAVAYCEKVVVPTVVGVVRPAILLPLTVLSGLRSDQVEALLAHELAHIRRFDHLVNLAQRMVEAVLFFHPAVWIISRRIRIERENCCDDMVVASGGEAVAYAASLVQMAELSRCIGRTGRLAESAALTATRGPSGLHRRVTRLLGAPPHEQLRVRRSWTLALGLVAVAALLTAAYVNTWAAQSAGTERSNSEKSSSTARSAAAPELTRETLLNIIKKERDSITTCHFKWSVRAEVKVEQEANKGVPKYCEYEVTISDGKLRATSSFEKGAPPMWFTIWNGKVLKKWCPVIRKGQIGNGTDLSSAFTGANSPLHFSMLADTKDHLWYRGVVKTYDLVAVLEDPHTIVATEKHGGIEAIVVKEGDHTIWLDPARGYAVVEQVYDAGLGRPLFRWKNVTLQDCGNGLWIPTEMVTEDYLSPNSTDGPAGALSLVKTTKATALEINKEYPDSLFELQFPQGTRVDDHVTNMTYESGTEKTDAGMVKDSAACQINLALIVKGINTYESQNNYQLPPSLADLFPQYVTNPKVLVCPADKTPMTIKNGLACSYRYIGNVRRDFGSIFIAYDHAQHDGGHNVAYYDGDVHHVAEQDFKAALAKMYEQLKPLMAKADFPGDRERVKAFCEDKDFPEEASAAVPPAAPSEKPKEQPQQGGAGPAPKELPFLQYDVVDILTHMDGTKLLEMIIQRTGRENWDIVHVLANKEVWSHVGSFDDEGHMVGPSGTGGDGVTLSTEPPFRILYLRKNWLLVQNADPIQEKIQTILAELRGGTPPAPAENLKEAAQPTSSELGRVSISLNAPNLQGGAVQFAIFEKDPVPGFKSRLFSDRLALVRALNNGRSAMTITNKGSGETTAFDITRHPFIRKQWDSSFGEVTGKDVSLLQSSPDKGEYSISFSSTATTKWLVTKAGLMLSDGKTVCWCIPFKATPAGTEIVMKEKNALYLDPIFDEVMSAPAADAGPARLEEEAPSPRSAGAAPTEKANEQAWPTGSATPAPGQRPPAEEVSSPVNAEKLPSPTQMVIKLFRMEGGKWSLSASEARLEEGGGIRLIAPVFEEKPPASSGPQPRTVKGDEGVIGKDAPRRIRMSGNVRVELAGLTIATADKIEFVLDAPTLPGVAQKPVGVPSSAQPLTRVTLPSMPEEFTPQKLSADIAILDLETLQIVHIAVEPGPTGSATTDNMVRAIIKKVNAGLLYHDSDLHSVGGTIMAEIYVKDWDRDRGYGREKLAGHLLAKDERDKPFIYVPLWRREKVDSGEFLALLTSAGEVALVRIAAIQKKPPQIELEIEKLGKIDMSNPPKKEILPALEATSPRAGSRERDSQPVPPPSGSAPAPTEKVKEQVSEPPSKIYFVRLVVGKNKMTFEGEETTWDQLPKLLEKVPNRQQTVLELSMASDQLTVGEFYEAEGQASALARRFGFKYLSNNGVHPLGSKGSAPKELPEKSRSGLDRSGHSTPPSPATEKPKEGEANPQPSGSAPALPEKPTESSADPQLRHGAQVSQIDADAGKTTPPAPWAEEQPFLWDGIRQ